MCGIAGAFGPVPVSDAAVRRTLASMRKRGPNASGVHRDTVRGVPLTLLHSRLSIVDLDPRANQPFAFDDCFVVFNGEIYNHIEVRAELEAAGHVFTTRSDTEVLVHAYRQYGPACVDRFEGMWSIALLDRRNETLWLSRDRFGEKPLYYWEHRGTLFFASEVKALAALAGQAPDVNLDQLRRYLVNGYKSLYKRDETFFRGVRELPPGSSALLRTPAAPKAEHYWRLRYAPQPMSLDEAVAGVRERLGRAVALRLRADVPLAFCLSGGVDSSALACIAAKEFGADVRAFSIVDSDERYNEIENMRAVVNELDCEHTVVEPGTDRFFERMADLVGYHDSPIVTISYYVHSFLSEAIGKECRVSVSGTAADELFTGYYDHYAFWLAEMHGRKDFDRLVQDWRDGYGKHVRNPLLQDPLTFHREPKRRDHMFQDRDVFASYLREPLDEEFDEADYGDNTLRRRMLNELFHEAVPVILHEDDLNSMRWSVENRSPYLDRELAEFAYSIPNEHLIHDGFAKWPLRAAAEGLVPDSVRLDKRKRGFNASLDTLVDRDDPETMARLLDDSPVFDLVDRERVAGLLKQDHGRELPNTISKFLFSFISTKTFLETDLARGRATERAVA